MDFSQLSERKTRILKLLISDYISSAEPVGSRTIAKKYNLGISSATIRNEMSDLEEMGYIVAPHASAGRVPSDKGYRLYVDKLMQKRELSREEAVYLRRIVIDNIDRIDSLMQETVKALSLITNYTAVAAEVTSEQVKIQQLQFMPLDESSVLLVIVTNAKNVRNFTIRVSSAPSFETLMNLSAVMNRHLREKTAGEITAETFLSLQSAFGDYAGLVEPALRAVTHALSDEKEAQVFTSGARHILGFPEFFDLEKARAIFHTLEEKDLLVMLMDGGSPGGAEIVIGQENGITQLKGCSVIKAKYKLNGLNYGTIGIIGPTRMDYPQVISALNEIVKHINRAIAAMEDG